MAIRPPFAPVVPESRRTFYAQEMNRFLEQLEKREPGKTNKVNTKVRDGNVSTCVNSTGATLEDHSVVVLKESVWGVAADAWDAGTTYAKGDFVLHNGQRWEGIADPPVVGNEPGVKPDWATTSDLDSFQRDIQFDLNTPTTYDNEPIGVIGQLLEDSETGEVITDGIAICQVNISELSLKYATWSDTGLHEYLENAASGNVKIVYRSDGTGTLPEVRWCIVQLGTVIPSDTQIYAGKTEQIIQPGGRGVVRRYDGLDAIGVAGTSDEGQIEVWWEWTKQNDPPELSEGIEIRYFLRPDLVETAGNLGGDFDPATEDHVSLPWNMSEFGDISTTFNSWSVEWRMIPDNTAADNLMVFSAMDPANLTTDRFELRVQNPTTIPSGHMRVSTAGPSGQAVDDWTGVSQLTDGEEHLYRVESIGTTEPLTLRLYVDNLPQLPDVTLPVGEAAFPDFPVLIGKGRPVSPGPDYFQGTIRDFNVRISGAQYARYNFDEQSGTNIADSVSGQDGTLNTLRVDEGFWALNQGESNGMVLLTASCEPSMGGTLPTQT